MSERRIGSGVDAGKLTLAGADAGKLATIAANTTAPSYVDPTRGVAATALKPQSDGTYCDIFRAVYGTHLMLLTGAGCYRLVGARNRNAAMRYLLVFDNNTASGAPKMSFDISPGGSCNIGADVLGIHGIFNSTYVYVIVSTSPSAYAGPTSAEHDVWERGSL